MHRFLRVLETNSHFSLSHLVYCSLVPLSAVTQKDVFVCIMCMEVQENSAQQKFFLLPLSVWIPPFHGRFSLVVVTNRQYKLAIQGRREERGEAAVKLSPFVNWKREEDSKRSMLKIPTGTTRGGGGGGYHKAIQTFLAQRSATSFLLTTVQVIPHAA